MASRNSPQCWDIFCAVVDNYGDIGVTWRLAKQLSAEKSIIITLWVDDLKSFSHILPALDPNLISQVHFGVTINQWSEPLAVSYQAGNVLIEAFACELPEQVKNSLISMQHAVKLNPHAPKPPVWLNLTYFDPILVGFAGLKLLKLECPDFLI